MSDLTPQEIVVACAAVRKAITGMDKSARAALVDDMGQGDRRTVRDTANGKLGSVSLSDPKDVVEVDDEDSLLKWLLMEGKAEEVTRIEAPDWAIKDALEAARNGADIPGVLRKPGNPTLSVRVEPHAVELAASIISSLPQIGGGQ